LKSENVAVVLQGTFEVPTSSGVLVHKFASGHNCLFAQWNSAGNVCEKVEDLDGKSGMGATFRRRFFLNEITLFYFVHNILFVVFEHAWRIKIKVSEKILFAIIISDTVSKELKKVNYLLQLTCNNKLIIITLIVHFLNAMLNFSYEQIILFRMFGWCSCGVELTLRIINKTILKLNDILFGYPEIFGKLRSHTKIWVWMSRVTGCDYFDLHDFYVYLWGEKKTKFSKFLI